MIVYSNLNIDIPLDIVMLSESGSFIADSKNAGLENDNTTRVPLVPHDKLSWIYQICIQKTCYVTILHMRPTI